jgi:hypothetical protein
MKMANKLTTPIGTVKFPQISTPDAKGKYGLALVLDPAEEAVKKFMDELNQAVAESSYPKYTKLVKADKQKNESGELAATGKILINFTSSYPIALFDSQNNAVEKAEVGWGSRVRVAFTLKEFDVDGSKGLTKYIRGVQIIELKGGASAESCGFTKEEGYVVEQKSETPWEE